MKRCIVRRKADGLYLAKWREWVTDPQKARIFTNVGHAKNSLIYVPYRIGFVAKDRARERKVMWDALYEEVPISFSFA